MPKYNKKGSRKYLITEQAGPLITIGFKGSVKLNDKIKRVAEHEGVTVSDLLRKILTISIDKRVSRIKKNENESTRDRLLREIAENT